MLNKNFLIEKKSNQEKISCDVALCDLHPHARHWLQIGLSDNSDRSSYRCEQCNPPPSQAFVKRYWGDDGKPKQTGNIQASNASAHLLAARTSTHTGAGGLPHQPSAPPRTINYERPTCPHCRGAWITELDQGNTITLRCWSCKRELLNEELQHQLNQPISTKTHARCSSLSLMPD